MKLFVLFLAALSVVTVNAIEYKSAEFFKNVHDVLAENSKTQDQSVVASVKKYIDSVEPKNDQQKRNVIKFKVWVYDQTKGSDTSFEGLSKYRDELIAKEKFEVAPTEAQKLEMLDIWYKYRTDKDFVAKMYNAIKATPNGHRFSNAGVYAYRTNNYLDAYNFYMENQVFPERCVEIAIKNLKDTKKVLDAAQVITKKNYDAKKVKPIVDCVINNLTTSDSVDQNEVKLFLQKVNKRYSRLMKEDEATWAPIIGDVRMTLAAY
jgi:hypothetical protein